MTPGSDLSIPFLDVKASYLELKQEIDDAIARVMDSGWYLLGKEIEAFESEYADYSEARHCVGLANGLEALVLALKALGVGPGDEVIVPANTYIATWLAVSYAGAVPVPVEPVPGVWNIDPDRIEAALTSRTKVILPVHLYGQPADLEPILAIAARHGLRVLEDAAQAHGARYGGRRIGACGDITAWSFYPGKNLGCFGDGGMVVTNDRELFARVEMLRRHGGKVKYHHAELGLNSRLDELQAAVLRVKLPHLESWNDARRRNAHRYNRMLAPLTGIERPRELSARGTKVPTGLPNAETSPIQTVYHQYTIATDDRDAVAAALKADGVQTMVYYPVPLHLQEVHADLQQGLGSFPHAERAAARCLSLPMFPELSEDDQQRVVRALTKAVAKMPRSAAEARAA